MSVGQAQLYNTAWQQLMLDGNVAWDAASAGNWYWVLALEAYTPSDAHSTLNDLGANYISSGDGAPLVRAAGSITIGVSNETQLVAGNANFGSNVTITAKYLVAVQGNSSAPATTDGLIFYQDLLQEGGSAQSSSSDFVVNAPANSVWARINAQA